MADQQAFPIDESELTPEFAAGLQALLALSEAQRAACVRIVSELAVSTSQEQSDGVFDRLDADIENSGLSTCLRAFDPLLSAVQRQDPSRVFDFLFERRLVAADDKERFLEVLAKLRSEVVPRIHERGFVRGLGPFFESILTTVELRGIPDLKGDNVAALVGVVSIAISVDTGESYYLQAGKDEILRIISSLQRALRMLDAAETMASRT